MTNHGDDCYFFYYSTCTKGDSCPFRHCEAAKGSEIVCSLWEENRCFRKVCKFRHMEIKKNRKEIPCYWENQPMGCQKPHCAFYHEKPRLIDGIFVPASKGLPVLKKDGEEEPAQEEPAPNPSNPQLRGVIKADTQENVPSPTHPPVVINPVDDEDEDEDDQYSEEGEDRSKMSSPRKLIMGPKDDSLNFNVRTLEEIRLRKALKASLKKAEAAGFTVPGQHNNGSTGEKENMGSIGRPALFTTKNRPEEAGKLRIADRLEKRTLNDSTLVEGELPLKRSLAQRLGGKVGSSDENLDVDQPSQQGTRSIRERLSLPTESGSTPSPAVPSKPAPSGEIRIKTLEEIRQEKAAKAQASGDSPTNPPKKATAEKPLAKKQQGPLKRKVRVVSETSDTQQGKETPEAAPVSTPVNKPPAPTPASGEVRVKTLEEIRREKAARLGAQAQSPRAASNPSSSSGSEEGDAPNKRRILLISKTPSPASSSEVKVQKPVELPEKSKDGGEAVANGKATAPAVEKVHADSGSGAVNVKTFEEIMREKQLRKQQQEQEVAQSQGSTAAQKQPVNTATTTSMPTPTQPPSFPVRQRITVKPKIAPAKLAVAVADANTTEPPAAANVSPKDLPVRLAKRQRTTAAADPAAAPVPVPTLPVQQTPVATATQSEPVGSLAKRLRTAAVPVPAPASTSTPLPVQQTPVSSTAQPEKPVSLAKKPKTTAAAASVSAPAPAPSPVQQTSVSGTAQAQAQSDTPESLAKKPKITTTTTTTAAPAPAPSPAPLPVPQAPALSIAQPDTTLETSPLKKSPENKVKPKVNVKPVVKSSSVKPSAHVRPGQKRKAAAGQGSAVAAVKPLSPASTAGGEASELQEPPCKRSEVSTQGPLQGPVVSSSAIEGYMQQNDEPQTVPVFEQSPATPTTTSVENVMAVPQGPSVPKTPSQVRTRKGSTTTPRTTSTSAASSTSAVDDFEELINEFEMDDEVDLEPDKGEDDILLELSEMIGS